MTDQIANFDIIACRRDDGRYDVKQMTPGGHLILLREGPFDAAHAATAARQIAMREGSEAWIEHSDGAYMCLNS